MRKYIDKIDEEKIEIILRKDDEWLKIEGEPCRVISFTPLALVENGKVKTPNKTDPYAYVVLECKKIHQIAQGFICHKIDFQHLWEAFRERGVQENEEVIIFYSKNRDHVKIFSYFMPRLLVWICKKGTFELMTNPKTELEWFKNLEERPIAEWRPDVL